MNEIQRDMVHCGATAARVAVLTCAESARIWRCTASLLSAVSTVLIPRRHASAAAFMRLLEPPFPPWLALLAGEPSLSGACWGFPAGVWNAVRSTLESPMFSALALPCVGLCGNDVS